MTERIKFELDGKQVEAEPGETIWQVAKREGTRIPHLCHLDEPGSRTEPMGRNAIAKWERNEN